jgi:predicted Ser/Thr protein kinase
VPATSPPTIPGFTFVEPIGEGGFADVYLYEQRLPARRVAVKVLKKGTDSQGLEMFYAEANVMAQLSSHPSIMPIFQADVSAEGRPFLVMEFCPGPHLAQRFRSERIPVPEILETAVKVASAVETAHRAGILHRDIKPHNLLTNAYGAPLLTDFGIASTAEGEGPEQAMSIPWSAPEALADTPTADARSDVFSLAATVYSLLAGRSPFEVPGAANDNATLISRIERQQPSRILRSDVPDSLNAVLLRAMAKRPADRPQSAMEFARSLQEVEIELHRAPTRLEVLDAGVPGAPGDQSVSDARTMIKPVSVIIPDELPATVRPREIGQPAAQTILQRRFQPVAGDVSHGPAMRVGSGDAAPAKVEHSPSEPVQQRRANLAAVVVVALVVAAVVVFGAISMLQGGKEPDKQAGGFEQPPADAAVGQVDPAPAVSAKRVEDGWRFTWVNPAPQAGDLYKVARTLDGQAQPDVRTAEPSYDFRIGSGRTGCLVVTVIHKNLTQRAEASQPLCEVGK